MIASFAESEAWSLCLVIYAGLLLLAAIATALHVMEEHDGKPH